MVVTSVGDGTRIGGQDAPDSGVGRGSIRTAGEGPLESIANSSSPYRPVTVSEQGKRRFRGQEVNWVFSKLQRCRDCGRVAVTPGGSVAVRESSGIVGFAGLATCGSVWGCSVCNAKIMARRNLEIGSAIEVWESRGGSVAFGTVTMQHRSGQSLDDLWACLSKAWAKVTSGKAWISNKKRHGIAGWLKVVEVTFGVNGWHVHIHYLLFLEASTVERDLDGLKKSIFGRWSSGLKAAGLPAPLMIGQDLRLLDGPADEGLAEYFTKAGHNARSIGQEMTNTQSKRARGSHSTRSVWEFLDELIDTGDADALDRWHEWQRGSKGRRQLTWSKGLRELLGLRFEKSDEDIAAEELGSKADDLVIITAAGWRTVIEGRLRVQILESVYQHGFRGLRSLLDRLGVEYQFIGERSAA